jgi:hypothetical protein
MNYFSNNKAQGTIEYLVIISVIVVIALALVTFLLAQGDTAQEISKSSDKASNVIGKGGISVTGSVTSSSGDTVISLKNNSGETLTITNLSATNEQGKESSLDYNEDVLPGYEIPLILVDTNLACPCIDGKPTTCKIKITFVGSSGLVKTETLTIKSDSCVQTINYFTLNYTAGTGGSIIGNTTQKILPGKNGSTVTAQPNEGYVFSEWSDGSTNPTRSETNVTQNLTLTATFIESEEETLECIPAGGYYIIPSDIDCCEGLTPILIYGGIDPCGYYIRSKKVCSNCGNGTCESWENICNCSADC